MASKLALPALAIVLLAIIRNSEALTCYGSTCSAGQYCEIFPNTQTGTCYTHHGHGHHETHQACLGAHHPHDHCFCIDQACVDRMMMTTTMADTTTMAPTTMGGSNPTTTMGGTNPTGSG